MAPRPEPSPKEMAKPANEQQERRRGTDAMLRHRILIVSGEANMRRSLRRLMTATGAATEFIADLSKLPAEPPSLMCVDLRSSSAPKMKDVEKIFPDKGLMSAVVLLAAIGDQAGINRILKNSVPLGAH